MANRTVVTEGDVKQFEVPDGVSMMPAGVGVAPDSLEGPSLPENGLASVPASNDSLDDFLQKLIEESESESVVPAQVVVGDRVIDFGVVVLDEASTSSILKKRMRGVGGKLTPSADSDIILKTEALVQCVRKNKGTPEKPEWVPFWSREEITGSTRVKGLMHAQGLLARQLRDGVLNEVYAYNQMIHPLFLEAVEKVMATQASASLNG